MILERLEMTPHEFEARTGWALKPQGACKGDFCVPLGGIATGPVDVRALAERLGMPLVEHDGVFALGPSTIGRALETVEAPALTLPDRNGNPVSLSDLRRLRVCLIAWASW